MYSCYTIRCDFLRRSRKSTLKNFIHHSWSRMVKLLQNLLRVIASGMSPLKIRNSKNGFFWPEQIPITVCFDCGNLTTMTSSCAMRKIHDKIHLNTTLCMHKILEPNSQKEKLESVRKYICVTETEEVLTWKCILLL